MWFEAVPYELDGLVELPQFADTGSVAAIADTGIIAGIGAFDGYYRAYRMTPRVGPTADLTEDCAVDAADLGVLLRHWGSQSGRDASGADINDDGVVDGADIGLLLAQWTVGADPIQ